MSQTNRVAVITGGSSGMGAACARESAAAGYRVVIAGRTASKAQRVAAEIGDDEPLVGDVGDPAFCQHIIDTAMSRHGRVDALITAAGIIARAGAVATTDDQWQRVLDVNLGGVFHTCRAVLPIMKQQGGGVIVNFGSIWGDVAAAGVAAYCASKGAVHNLTRALALEHAKDNIRINTIAPGEVNTPMLQSERKELVTQELLDGIAQTVPMGRLADPAEIARVVLFMASDAASYMTGSTITVDAAFTAR